MENEKTICPGCKKELSYRAVTKEEIKQPHEFGTIAAFCQWCGSELLPTQE